MGDNRVSRSGDRATRGGLAGMGWILNGNLVLWLPPFPGEILLSLPPTDSR
jgi:hypothetical protein